MTNPSVLVIDDNFAVESTVAYDRLAFLEDYGNAGLDFSFCSGRGSDTQEYTSDAVVPDSSMGCLSHQTLFY